MIRNIYTRLVLILIVAALAIWVDVSDEIQILNPINDSALISRNIAPRLGLDLQGGLQVLLEADLPAGSEVDATSMETARSIVENRTNALGVSENVIQLAGDRRIVGEFPGAEDADAILDIIQQTGLMEFVDTGDFRPEEGSILQTDFAGGTSAQPTPTPTDANGTESPQPTYHTIMTGKELTSVNVGTNASGQPAVDFVLSSEGAAIFAKHTRENTGKILAITLDKRVVSAPSIEGEIPDGQGQVASRSRWSSARSSPSSIVRRRRSGPCRPRSSRYGTAC